MGKISKTAVTLSVRGQDIRPDDVSRFLGCQPTRVARTGEEIVLNSGKTRTVRRGYWQLESEPSDTREIGLRIEALLGRLNSDSKIWDTLAQEHDIELFCGLFLDGWNEGFVLSSGLLADIGCRHIRLDFDIYSPVDSWPESSVDNVETLD